MFTSVAGTRNRRQSGTETEIDKTEIDKTGKTNEEALVRSAVGRRSTMLMNSNAREGANPCILLVIGNNLSSTPRKVSTCLPSSPFSAHRRRDSSSVT